MPFTALYKNDTINSLNIEQDFWNELKASEQAQKELRCPDCEGLMIARAGIGFKVAPHFAHITDAQGCQLLGESKEHLYIKQLVFEACQSLGLEATTEQRIDLDGETRIADVCVPSENKIVEVQLTNQSNREYYHRDNWYRRAGYESLWLTWQEIGLLNLAYAKIMIRNEEVLLGNKEQIFTADELYLSQKHVVFQETPNLKYTAYDTDLDFQRVELSEVVGNFLSGSETFTIECEAVNNWHWCGQVCRDACGRIAELSEEHKQKRIAYLRKNMTPQILFFPNGKSELDISFIDDHIQEIRKFGLFGELKEAVSAAFNQLEEQEIVSGEREVVMDYV